MRNFNQWSLAVVSLILLTAGALADTEKSNQLVDDAWDVWDNNDQAAVEAKFQEAIAQDPANERASLGLAALYTMQEKYEKALNSFVLCWFYRPGDCVPSPINQWCRSRSASFAH